MRFVVTYVKKKTRPRNSKMASSKQTLKTILSISKHEGLELEKVKDRRELKDIVAAIKLLVAEDGEKGERMIVEKLKFGTWQILGDKTDYMQIEEDIGYPTSMEELEAMVLARRLENFGVNPTKDAYLKYLTTDQYKIESKDWGTWAGKEADGAESQNSVFFVTKKNEKVSISERYRKANRSARQVMSLYLRDEFLREGFFRGDFTTWKEFEARVATLKGFGDGAEDHDPLSTFRKKLKEIINSGNSSRIKYAALSTLAGKYFIHEVGNIKNRVWENEQTVFPGPDNVLTPAFHMFILQVACLGMSDQDFEKMEKEFKRLNKSYAPKTVAENRPNLLQLMTQVEQGKTFEQKINQVDQVETIKIAQLAEVEDIDDFDDLILEEFESGQIGNILLARERKFGTRQSERPKKAGPYRRVQNFAQAIRAPPKPRNGPNKTNQPPRQLPERYCTWAACEGSPKHLIKDCPKGTKRYTTGRPTGRVRQVEEEDQTAELESNADKIRASIGIC